MPASPLLDPTAPMLGRYTVALEVAPPPEPVRVAITVASEVAQPGSLASLTLRLTDEAGAPVSGEVSLFAVDVALLNVRPHPLRNLSTELAPSLPRDYYRSRDSYEALVSAESIGLSAARLQVSK